MAVSTDYSLETEYTEVHIRNNMQESRIEIGKLTDKAARHDWAAKVKNMHLNKSDSR